MKLVFVAAVTDPFLMKVIRHLDWRPTNAKSRRDSCRKWK